MSVSIEIHSRLVSNNLLTLALPSPLSALPGKTSVPEVFFNSTLVGGADDLARLDGEGKLEGMIKECLEAADPAQFPPPLRTPKNEEYLQVG